MYTQKSARTYGMIQYLRIYLLYSKYVGNLENKEVLILWKGLKTV